MHKDQSSPSYLIPFVTSIVITFFMCQAELFSWILASGCTHFLVIYVFPDIKYTSPSSLIKKSIAISSPNSLNSSSFMKRIFQPCIILCLLLNDRFFHMARPTNQHEFMLFLAQLDCERYILNNINPLLDLLMKLLIFGSTT